MWCKSDEGIQKNKAALKAELTHTELGESGSAEIVCCGSAQSKERMAEKVDGDDGNVLSCGACLTFAIPAAVLVT